MTTRKQAPRTAKNSATPKANAKAAAPKKAAPKAATAALPAIDVYLVDPGTPYGCFKTDDLKGAFTQAMLELCGIATRTKAGRVDPVKVKPETMARRVATWGRFVEKTAYKHWRTTTQRIDVNGLTAKGRNEAAERLAGTSKAFRTNAELTDKVLALLKKGGELSHKGHVYKFTFKRPLNV